MMTSRERQGRRRDRRALLALWGGAWALECLLGPAAPAFAQRRRAEPEANPTFQEQVQGEAPQGGQPLTAPPGPAEPSPETLEPGGGGGEAPPASPFPSRNVQGVQIGSAGAPPAPPPPPTSPLETRVTVRVKDAPLATFLDTISAQAKVNFIITEGLTQKRVTAFLQNVTVREALQILLEIKGLTYQQIGRSNTYVVSPRSQTAPNQITRIYTLNYIPLAPILSQEETGGAFQSPQGGGTAGGGGSQAGGQGGGQGIGPGGGQGGQRGGGGGDREGPIAILNVLRSLLSQNGRVSVEPRSNALIVTDIPEVFPQVEQIIAELDKKVPQVMIEAQIVQINSDRTQQLGIEWGGTDGELGRFTAGARTTNFPLGLPRDLSHTHIFGPSDTLTTGTVDLRALAVVLRALVIRSEARFLGKPKVMTLNNKRATIQITRNQALSLQTTNSQQAGSSTSGTQAERANTGLLLNVTPQVNKEGYVTLLVEPSFTDVLEAGISTQSNRVFDTVRRQASTLLRLKNGQTVVLGGLLSSTETRSKRKVPFLGYIPLVGWLFTSVSVVRNNTDLVIFITPTIVND